MLKKHAIGDIAEDIEKSFLIRPVPAISNARSAPPVTAT
jgi:hypothetical protein